MKHTVVIFMLALACAGAFAQTAPNSGISFFHGSWNEALAEAKKQNKLIFVDVYAEWCGPCKAMAMNTFTNTEVGNFYNKNFINYKLDAEKGEGPGLAARWEVSAYPTLVYVNAVGDVVFRAMGSMPPADLLDMGQKALAEKGKSRPVRQEAAPGTEELLEQALKLQRKGEDYGPIAAQYFAAQHERDLLTNRGWEAISALTTKPDSREFLLLLEKRATFTKIGGSLAVQTKISDVLRTAWQTSLEAGDSKAQDNILAIAEKAGDNGQILQRLKMEKFIFLKDSKSYAEATIQYFTAYTITDTAQLNDAVNQFVNLVEEQDKLIFADRWARQSLALANSYHTHLLYARLHAKRGEYFKGMGEAKQAAHFPGITEEQQTAALALVNEIQAQIR